ncbi:MAG: hypothetical protein H0U86_13825 [Chloroflexi bacterium]|nr:hypothetical protein [Chloroflexota bacterium]
MKHPAFARLAAPVLAIGLISACAAGIGPGATSDIDPQTSESPTREPFETTSPLASEPAVDGPSEVPDDVWAAVIGALETHVDGTLEAEAVELVSFETVTWNDGSLGCPKPGQAYTQALVDGFRVVVKVDGDEFDYRVPLDGEPRLCESDLPRGG